jgi:hypothetical protein
MAATVRSAVCEAIRELLVEVPPIAASARQRADFLLHKAEVFDLIAIAGDLCMAAQAREIATHARYEARQINRESQQGDL